MFPDEQLLPRRKVLEGDGEHAVLLSELLVDLCFCPLQGHPACPPKPLRRWVTGHQQSKDEEKGQGRERIVHRNGISNSPSRALLFKPIVYPLDFRSIDTSPAYRDCPAHIFIHIVKNSGYLVIDDKGQFGIRKSLGYKLQGFKSADSKVQQNVLL